MKPRKALRAAIAKAKQSEDHHRAHLLDYMEDELRRIVALAGHDAGAVAKSVEGWTLFGSLRVILDAHANIDRPLFCLQDAEGSLLGYFGNAIRLNGILVGLGRSHPALSKRRSVLLDSDGTPEEERLKARFASETGVP